MSKAHQARPSRLSPETSALITEEQVMLGSAAALAPAPSHRWSDAAHEVAAAVRAMFTRPEKPRARRHYPQRFGYLENAAMSRAMDRAVTRVTVPEGVFRPTPNSHFDAALNVSSSYCTRV